MMSTTAKKLAAATALAGMLIGIAPGAASAGPKDEPKIEIELKSDLPSDVFNPPLPFNPGYPPLEPTIPPPNTNARPIVDWVECYHDDYLVNFTDMDAPDLRMTVEIAFIHGPGGYQVRTMYYSSHVDGWFITLPDGATNVLIQAVDQDGNYSHAISLRYDPSLVEHPIDKNYCNIKNINVFNNDRTTDSFAIIGAR